MNTKDYTNANKEAWNEVVPKHQKANKNRLDRAFSKPGHIVQSDENLLSTFNILEQD